MRAPIGPGRRLRKPLASRLTLFAVWLGAPGAGTFIDADELG